MPYISEKIKLTKDLDRRCKLNDQQKEEIREKYATGFYSHRTLAEEYQVSKRLISFVLNPDKYEIAKAQARERRKDGRYVKSKEEHAAIIREHRQYKQKLYLEGKLKCK